MSGHRLIILLAILSWYLVCDALYLPVWRSPESVWSYGAQQAPLKGRPQINLAKLRFADGDDAGMTYLVERAQMADALRGRR